MKPRGNGKVVVLSLLLEPDLNDAAILDVGRGRAGFGEQAGGEDERGKMLAYRENEQT